MAQQRPDAENAPSTASLHIRGTVPSESWNPLGTKVIPKLRSGTKLNIEIRCSVQVSVSAAANLESEIEQALNDLGPQDALQVQRS